MPFDGDRQQSGFARWYPGIVTIFLMLSLLLNTVQTYEAQNKVNETKAFAEKLRDFAIDQCEARNASLPKANERARVLRQLLITAEKSRRADAAAATDPATELYNLASAEKYHQLRLRVELTTPADCSIGS